MGTVADCWGSIRARITQGTWKLGWYHAATDTYVEIAAVASGYARTSGVAAPPHVDAKLALWTETDAPGDHLYVILWCCGVGARVPDEVPSRATAGVDTAKAQGTVTINLDPSDVQGTINLEQTPRLHGTAAPTTAETLLELGATEMLGLDGAGDIELQDSTNEANATLAEADGVARTIRSAWDAGGLYVAEVGGDDGAAAFDGSWPAGQLEIKGTCRSTNEITVYDGANKTST